MNLEDIKGLGPKTIELLAKLNITSIRELLKYYPYKYNILKKVKLEETTLNPGLIVGVIESAPRVMYFKKNMNAMYFNLIVENRLIKVTIFNRAFMRVHLKQGRVISLIGKYDLKLNRFTASEIRLEEIKESQIEVRYHLVKGLSSKQINKIILNVLDSKIDIEDNIPLTYVKENKLIDEIKAINTIHNPKSVSDLKYAMTRLVYNEFFEFMFKMNYLKEKRTINKYCLKRVVDYKKVEELINTLPFELTSDQVSAVKEIYTDLTTNKRGNRLLLGDVGSGKTIVSLIALYINYLGGYQGVLMAPTEVLAIQHYNSFKSTLKDLNIELLTGSLKVSEKKKIYKKLLDGEIDILIGTHSLINDDVVFNNLGLVITDEQHRFGVNQRRLIQNKGVETDILYMSATPIPRTYALALYGDMDLSIIKTKPSNRKEIKTIVKKESEITEVLENIYSELKLGHQIYVVAPLIEDEDETNINDIKKLEDNYNKAFGKIANIKTLHGKMKKQEKNDIMKDFKDGKINILISTTVIEVGIDVKNSTIMVIYNAEKFGLATLHQLRGRVGRNEMNCYCYLISNKDVKRLHVLEESNDGFYISEKDFELRGEGDIFGTLQSGDMAFKIGNIKRDYKILMKAKEDSYNYLQNFDNNKYFTKIMKNLDINN